MSVITARITVAADGSISGHAPSEVPPGDHLVALTLPAPPAGKPFLMERFPSRDLGWDESISLRREDMYGDDGR